MRFYANYSKHVTSEASRFGRGAAGGHGRTLGLVRPRPGNESRGRFRRTMYYFLVIFFAGKTHARRESELPCIC